ncbi:hypothetical protein N0V88_001542 [Collariella sp. IMI 366227]|nr:hypothetical protein N0V88_001542 [Collariella sp. IMI 366227]
MFGHYISKFLTGWAMVAEDTLNFLFAAGDPGIWLISGAVPFVMDTGLTCDANNKAVAFLTMHLSCETQEATSTCHNGYLYYLTGVTGEEDNYKHCDEASGCEDEKFRTLPGLAALKVGSFRDVKVADIIIGSVNTYKANGNQNSGVIADPANDATFNDLNSQDVTTPGFI